MEGTREQIEQIKAQGITSFKAYTAYKDGIGVDDPYFFTKKVGAEILF
ncbi:hypothetical protein [Hespellia stercorisuis]|nr:hypothetical protein [Hespellia stercorisuis]